MKLLLWIILSFGLMAGDLPEKVLTGHEWSVTSLDINKKGNLLLSGS